jgi:pimeloyl-ACP methyl ester carboxylesterase
VLIAIGRDLKGDFTGFVDRYRVILIDYPPLDATADSFTPNRVCADILAVADAAAVDRFAWYGYSFSAVVGLQLASRTNRLTALVCGGWPPLGAPYQDMQNAQGPNIFAGFYRNLTHWNDREAAAALKVPRLVFAGANDIISAPGVVVRIGSLIAEHRVELETAGWSVRLLDGFAHELGVRPDVVVPVVRQFLDPILLRA